MTTKQFLGIIVKSIFYSFGWYITILLPFLLYKLLEFVSRLVDLDGRVTVAIGFGIVQVFAFLLCLKMNFSDILEKEHSDIEYEKRRFDSEKREWRNKVKDELSQEKKAYRKQLSEEKANFKNELSQIKREYSDKKKTIIAEYKELKEKLLEENLSIRLESYQCEAAAEIKMQQAQEREEEMLQLLRSTEPFTSLAELNADAIIDHYKQSEQNLIDKSHPAIETAKEVRKLRAETRGYVVKMKEYEYKISYIIKHFPKIGEYIDNDQDLLSVTEATSSILPEEDFRDRRKDYLSDEEYKKLSETQRSQLALDRYVKGRQKSKWQIGRDYELSCAHQLKTQGYKVILNGIKYQKEDWGRDLIARSTIGGMFGDEVLIIQCKNWSPNRPIRENVIMQLLGTTIEFEISFKHLNQEVVPVLMIPSYSQLSDTALRFVEKLNIRIMRFEMLEFPRIKCNINNNQKIYHLPFDQQYDRTEIKYKGECYAWTVAEAESMGFRRAMRHVAG